MSLLRLLPLLLAALAAAAGVRAEPAPAPGQVKLAQASGPSAPARRKTGYVEREEVQAFLKKLSEERKIPLEWLMKEVAVARYSPQSERLMTPKPKANPKTTPEKNFILYRRNFLSAERVERGIDFLKEHAETFGEVEAETGVSRFVVAAIIGIETFYGRNTGRFRVIDTLMTLSFDYTRRSDFYLAELADFLEFCWRQEIPVFSVRGSYAGALGIGQFMPGSLNAYGRDGDGDGVVDIIRSKPDAIASVANFLVQHGWRKNERLLYPVRATRAIFEATNSGGIHANTTVAELVSAGVSPVGSWTLPPDEKVLLIDLPWADARKTRGTDYYVGTESFAAVLNYNRSYFYGAVVAFLAEALERRFPEKRG